MKKRIAGILVKRKKPLEKRVSQKVNKDKKDGCTWGGKLRSGNFN